MMTPEYRDIIDRQVAWATLKFGYQTVEWFQWYYIHMRPSSADFPDGLFCSHDEMCEYLNVDPEPNFE